MHQFIFTLGFKFEAIQTNYHIGNLPHEWKTTHWPTLLVLCRDYYNSVNPKGVISSDKDSSPDSYSARMNQQKKVWEWFFKPMKFCKEIERDQRKFPDKCIYHLSKSHPTDSCRLNVRYWYRPIKLLSPQLPLYPLGNFIMLLKRYSKMLS